MLNSVNINLVAFSRFSGSVAGMVFTVFTISITVAEMALGSRYRDPSLPRSPHGDGGSPGSAQG
jgi:hypothetical protein